MSSRFLVEAIHGLHRSPLSSWELAPEDRGIFCFANVGIAGATQILSIWSLLDQSQWKTGDRVQVEIRVRLDALETFIETRLGDRYRSSDRGETLELALHRLVPEGSRFGRGFPLGDEGSADLLEDALITHGLPFANRVATGQLLLDDERLNPKWIAPMPWAVRRVLYRLATDPQASPARLIKAELGHLEADLRTKWEAIAQFTRGMDVDVRVNEGLQAFSAFADKVSNDEAFLIDLRAHVSRPIASSGG